MQTIDSKLSGHMAMAACLRNIASHGKPNKNEQYNIVNPKIPTSSLVSFWGTHGSQETSCAALAAIYIDRATARTGKLLNNENVNSYVAAALLLACKWCDDRSQFPLHKKYAAIFGLQISELNCLERQLIRDLDWDFFVSSSMFEAYCDGFVRILNDCYVSQPSNPQAVRSE